MSAQHDTGRRAAALAAAAQLGEMNDETADAIRQHRNGYAEKRAARNKPPVERRQGERRTGEFDRREGDRRRFSTMDDKLAAAAKKHDEERKFTGARHSAFGEYVEPEPPLDYGPGPQEIIGG